VNEALPPTLPLAGTLVLDLSRALAGPYCAQMLSDLGAEVIKIEQPARQDEMREWPPFYDDLATYFAVANRNKRCLTLDLKQPAGRDLLLRLAAKADVVVENYRYGVTEQLRIGYEDLRRVNAGIVLCSIRGFGKGPHENRPAYDAAMQAFTGIMSVTGDPRGDEQRAGVAVVDFTSGLYAACGVIGALRKRDQGGVGAHVEVSLVDSGINVMAYQLVTYLMTGRVIERAGTTHPAMVPCRVFRAADERSVLIVITNNDQFRSLCSVLGHDEWMLDSRYSSPGSRVDHRDEMHGLVQAEIGTKDRSHWLRAFEKAGVPFAPVNRVDDLAADPVFTEQLLGTVPYDGKELRLVRSPIRINGELIPIRRPPPRHGEHTTELLAELGLTASEIDELRAAAVI
jgi:crotonobetainyl-CoA:carnitine CoA-transferase CaiB-like acyl-CoA transferase